MWCAQVSVGDAGESFAFIYSIEDPKGNTQSGGVGAQVHASARVILQLKAIRGIGP